MEDCSYIGIDPSVNSTGICINACGKERFWIVAPKSNSVRITKKRRDYDRVISSLSGKFEYAFYDKTDISEFDCVRGEYYKTVNMMNICEKIKSVVLENSYGRSYIVLEGISYGSSVRTKSVFDLAGLNYLVRSVFLEDPRFHFYVIPPSKIKKFATGKGNASKEMMLSVFRKKFPEFDVLHKEDDICDAYWMMKYSESISDEGIE